jgi:MFS family permease
VPAPRFLTSSFVLAWGGSFAQAVAMNLFLHLPGYLHELGADELAIGVIIAVPSLVALFVRLPLGWLSDLYGRRGIILAGGLLNTLGCALYLTVFELSAWVYAVRVVHGVAAVALMMTFFTYAADQIPPSRRAQGLGIFGLSGMFSISVAGVAGDVLIDRFGYAALFEVAAGMAFLSLVLALPLREERLATREEDPRFGELLGLAHQRDLVPVWLLIFLFGFALASAFTFFKTFTIESGVSSAGVFFAAYSLTAVVLRSTLGWLPDRVGHRPVLIPALLCSATGLAGLGHVANDLQVIVAGFLCGAGHAFVMPIISAQVVSRSPDEQRGAAIALLFTLMDGGMLLAGPLIGAFIREQGYPAAFSAAGAVVACALVIHLSLERRARTLALVEKDASRARLETQSG